MEEPTRSCGGMAAIVAVRRSTHECSRSRSHLLHRTGSRSVLHRTFDRDCRERDVDGAPLSDDTDSAPRPRTSALLAETAQGALEDRYPRLAVFAEVQWLALVWGLCSASCSIDCASGGARHSEIGRAGRAFLQRCTDTDTRHATARRACGRGSRFRARRQTGDTSSRSGRARFGPVSLSSR